MNYEENAAQSLPERRAVFFVLNTVAAIEKIFFRADANEILLMFE